MHYYDQFKQQIRCICLLSLLPRSLFTDERCWHQIVFYNYYNKWSTFARIVIKNANVFVCLLTMKIGQWANKKNFCSFCKIDILNVFDSLKIKQLLDYSFSSFELILCKRSWILSPIRNSSCITWLEGFCLETRLSKDWRLVFKPSIAFM